MAVVHGRKYYLISLHPSPPLFLCSALIIRTRSFSCVHARQFRQLSGRSDTGNQVRDEPTQVTDPADPGDRSGRPRWPIRPTQVTRSRQPRWLIRPTRVTDPGDRSRQPRCPGADPGDRPRRPGWPIRPTRVTDPRFRHRRSLRPFRPSRVGWAFVICVAHHSLCFICVDQHSLCFICVDQHSLCFICVAQHSLCFICVAQHSLCFIRSLARPMMSVQPRSRRMMRFLTTTEKKTKVWIQTFWYEIKQYAASIRYTNSPTEFELSGVGGWSPTPTQPSNPHNRLILYFGRHHLVFDNSNTV